MTDKIDKFFAIKRHLQAFYR